MNNIDIPDGLIPAEVTLVGEDGNAGAIMGRVVQGLRVAGNHPDVIASFRKQAMSNDYDHLLRVALAFTDEGAWGDE